MHTLCPHSFKARANETLTCQKKENMFAVKASILNNEKSHVKGSFGDDNGFFRESLQFY